MIIKEKATTLTSHGLTGVTMIFQNSKKLFLTRSCLKAVSIMQGSGKVNQLPTFLLTSFLVFGSIKCKILQPEHAWGCEI